VIKGAAKDREIDEATLREAAALTARYGQGRDQAGVTVSWWPAGSSTKTDDGEGIVAIRKTGGAGENSADGERRLIEVSPADGWRLAETLKRE